jgi:hypothetical protein
MNKHTKKRRSMKGGDCGCNTQTSVITGGCSTCGMIGGGCNCGLKGGSAYLDKVPVSNYYALNDYNHDPNMMQESVRISGVPVSTVKGGKKTKRREGQNNCRAKTPGNFHGCEASESLAIGKRQHWSTQCAPLTLRRS